MFQGFKSENMWRRATLKKDHLACRACSPVVGKRKAPRLPDKCSILSLSGQKTSTGGKMKVSCRAAERRESNSETGCYFVKRLENRGWEGVREQYSKRNDGKLSEVWSAMDMVYGLGILETPLKESPWLEECVDRAGPEKGPHKGSIHFKLESQQVTGSFKARGAAYRILALTEDEQKAGVVVSSTGNHALAVLHACTALERMGKRIDLEIFLPTTISERKLSKIERKAKECDAKVTLFGEDCIDAEKKARETAMKSGRVYISPYNDPKVIAGQGTIAVELLMERGPQNIDAVYVPVGGGGLISGIASVLKSISPHVKVVGCQPEKSDVMRRSVEAGEVVSIPWLETLSEGTAGGIEEGAITLEDCSQLVDEWVTVTEEEIAAAMVRNFNYDYLFLSSSSVS